MEDYNLDILKSIKKIEISDTVFEKLTYRIQLQKKQTIPFYKVAVAASLLLGFVLFEIFLIKNKGENISTQKIELVSVNNNHLYNE